MNGYLIILCALISLLIGAAGAYIIKSDIDKVRLEHAISAQQSADNTSCNADKKITEDADVKIQQANDALSKRVSAMLMQPATCVPVIAKRTVTAPAKVKPESARPDAGITTTWLIDYAGQCERDRLQLNGLIDFVNAVWARKQSHQ